MMDHIGTNKVTCLKTVCAFNLKTYCLKERIRIVDSSVLPGLARCADFKEVEEIHIEAGFVQKNREMSRK